MTKCYLISTTPKCVGVILAWDIFFFMNIAISKYMLHKRSLSIKACKCAWRIICYNKITQLIMALKNFTPTFQISICIGIINLYCKGRIWSDSTNMVGFNKNRNILIFSLENIKNCTMCNNFATCSKRNYVRFILNGKWHS